MKKQGFVKRSLKSTVNVRKWVSWDEIVASGKTVVSLGKILFTPKKAEHQETFEQAVTRLNLSEKDIKQRTKGFLQLAIIYAIAALGLFAYSIYIFSRGHILGGFICLVLTALVTAYAYKEHFWYTQVKHRKLGCSFKDWVSFNIRRGK